MSLLSPLTDEKALQEVNRRARVAAHKEQDRAFRVFMDTGCTVRELATKTGTSLTRITKWALDNNWEGMRAQAKTAALLASDERMDATRRVDKVIVVNAEKAAAVALPEYIKAIEALASGPLAASAKIPLMNEATEGMVKFMKGLRDVGLVVVPSERDLENKPKDIAALVPQTMLVQINAALRGGDDEPIDIEADDTPEDSKDDPLA